MNFLTRLVVNSSAAFRFRHFSTEAGKQYGTLATAIADKAVDSASGGQPQQSPSIRPAPKRPQRKPRVELPPNIWAYATAEHYKFDQLRYYLQQTGSYVQGAVAGINPSAPAYHLGGVTVDLKDKVLRLVAYPEKSNNNNNNEQSSIDPTTALDQKGEAFIFREGVVVMWNLDECQRLRILSDLRQFEANSFDQQAVRHEAEKLTYVFNDQIMESQFRQHEILHLRSPTFVGEEENFLEKFTISDAMSRSVKLAIRENLLTDFVNELNPVVENLRRGRIRMTKKAVLKKTGQLFALRHDINLDSDLADGSPDFYWERETLEKLYQQASRLFCIDKRIKVINEKLNYCLQLGERLDSHLSQRHSVRLERIIIFLIALEVLFELGPYLRDYWAPGAQLTGWSTIADDPSALEAASDKK